VDAAGALEQLQQLETMGGTSASEATALFLRARTTPDEGRAIDLLLARHAREPLPEELLVEVAAALVDRGEPEAAEFALSRATSSSALMLRADLLARAANLKGATALVERVLLRDIDFPGARERHFRWCAALGHPPRAPVGTLAANDWDHPRADAGVLLAHRPDVPFRLIREVARGGAGAVYEAEDRDLGRRIALKIYHRPDRDRSQLAHETSIAVLLAGPGVVRVWDVDVERGWLAMEWAPGGPLDAHLKASGPPRLGGGGRTAGWKATLPPTPIAWWAQPLSRTLRRIHDAGWAHLDVKPANVLLHAREGVVLTDFGTTRRLGEPSPPGSFGYVSPERLAGRPSDPRDDVYGFGRILEDAIDYAHPLEACAGWRALAAACTGPEAARPSNGAHLAELVETVDATPA
jgi:hypothetical protein